MALLPGTLAARFIPNKLLESHCKFLNLTRKKLRKAGEQTYKKSEVKT